MTAIMGHAGLLFDQYDADAVLLFDRFASDPAPEIKNKINSLILSLKDEGIWALLDSLYVPAKTGEQQGGLCDWRRPTKSATLNGSASWSNDNGFSSSGAAGDYVNLDYTPSVDGVNFTLHSAAAGCYVSVASVRNATEDYIGTSSASNNITRIQRTNNGSIHYATVNGAAGTSAFDNTSLSLSGKLVSALRKGTGTDTTTYLYVDGSSVGTSDTADATGLAAVSMYALARNNNGSDTANCAASLAVVYAGAALSDSMLSAFNAAIEVYLS